jgi:hypothetical protein
VCNRFDATILLEQPPDIEEIDGLFYFTDKVGGLTIRRVMRPSAFLRSLANCKRLAAEFAGGGCVVAFKNQ